MSISKAVDDQLMEAVARGKITFADYMLLLESISSCALSGIHVRPVDVPKLINEIVAEREGKDGSEEKE